MNIPIIGGPGAGRGMMPAKTVEKFNTNHISTGDIFRSKIRRGAALGIETKGFIDKGPLVPDGVASSMIKSCLEKLEDKKNGLLLGGYPKTLDQAKAFDTLAEGSELATDKVIVLETDFEKLVDRIAGRHIYRECGEICHVKSKPSKTDNVCDVCGGELLQRKDDAVKNLAVRLEEYSSQAAPVLSYYDGKGVVTRIDMNQLINSVWNDTLVALRKQEW